uniref:Isocitrate dehydrogenase [NAD] subunit gamma, mitochondrial-like n=1 Tax=Ciona intestinalis TaxID=7719 RepID=F6X7W0_CIOIN|nr:isocitrate dehydrogenase [NAD] subunit gamma, mitochondrial-like [Ciona intestinalis]|eukprot:XP_002122423.1 isocitrate dehydrogenase [NAD] subunit gamma, mitochondrial-like [Ciona intestinalis]
MSLTRTASSVLKKCCDLKILHRASSSLSSSSDPLSSTTSRQFALYGGRQTVTLIPGDGIGPEVSDAVRKIFLSAGVPVDFEEVNVTSSNLRSGSCEDALVSIRRNEVALKGNIETNVDELDLDEKSANVILRTKLDLFANVIKVKSIPGIITRHNMIDIRLIRENTEGEYSNLEHEGVPGVVESLKIITAKNSLRIARFAFEYAQRNGRKKVTAVHKANIMKLSDGLFLQCCREVACDFPDIEFEDMIIDNTTMQMVSNPYQFDVMVMPNLYGNILGNVCCGLVGGPGVVAGANIGSKHRVFETATRNTGKSIAGLNIANPSAFIFSSSHMLKYIGLHKYASLISQALVDTLQLDRIHTPDLGGSHTTSDVVDAVCKRVESQAYKVRYDQTPHKQHGW